MTDTKHSTSVDLDKLSPDQLKAIAQKLSHFAKGGSLTQEERDKMPPIRKPFGDEIDGLIAKAEESGTGITADVVRKIMAARAAKDSAIEFAICIEPNVSAR